MRKSGDYHKSMNNNSNPSSEILLSIIIPIYNNAKLLDITLENLLLVKTEKIEIIIIDGCSSDSFQNVVLKYKSFVDCIVSEPDCGIYYAINKGVNISRGKFYVVLGAGDYLYPAASTKMLDVLKTSQSNFILASVDVDKRQHEPMRGAIWRYGAAGIISHHSVGTFIRKDIHKKHGYYSYSYRLLADSHFILRCHMAKVAFERIYVCSGRYLGGGISEINKLDATLELFKLQMACNGNFFTQISLLCLRLIFHFMQRNKYD